MGNSIFSLGGAALYGGEIDKQRAVWERAAEIPGLDRAIWRYDAVGKVIRYSDHGDRSSSYGWEVDHYPVPTALGGTDDISDNSSRSHHAAELYSLCLVGGQWHDFRHGLAETGNSDRLPRLADLLEDAEALGFEHGDGDLLHR